MKPSTRLALSLVLVVVAGMTFSARPAHAAAVELVDTAWTTTSQFRSETNLPFFGAGTTEHIMAVNFYAQIGTIGPEVGGSLAGGTLLGTPFYDDLMGGAVAAAAQTGISDASFATGVTYDRGAYSAGGIPRNMHSTLITGTDSIVANNVALPAGFLNLGGDGTHTVAVHGLGAGSSLYVQLWGGVDQVVGGWIGDVTVGVNGVDNLVFNTQDDANGQAALFGFSANADGAGDLTLTFDKSGFFAFGGFAIQRSVVVPTPAALPAGLTLITLATMRRRPR